MDRFLIKSALFLSILMCVVHPTKAITLSAENAILMEQETGRVLYEKNASDSALIASITKLLTALVAVEQDCSLDDVVEITSEAVAVEGSSLYLQAGEEMMLEALLYGMLLHSGNDAATAIALHCAGSLDEFVALMNQKADELGMKNSSFANPHGLNADNHYASAYDMALVAQACLDNEIVSKIVETKQITLNGRTFTNKNKLLSLYDGCIGMKTGYTELAGRTLVSAATRDGMTLICVTLDAPDDWNDHSALFDYGFEQYTMLEVTPELAPTASVPVKNSLMPFVTVGIEESFRYPVTTQESIQWEIFLSPQEVMVPIDKGDSAEGYVRWFLQEEEVGQSALVYQDSMEMLVVEKPKLWDKFTKIVESIWFD